MGSCFGAGSLIPRDEVRGVAMGRKREGRKKKKHVYTGREKIQKYGETGRDQNVCIIKGRGSERR